MPERVLFFDDYPRKPDSVLFVWRLRLRLRPAHARVMREKSVYRLEAMLRSDRFAAIVLDIMASMSGQSDNLAGLEILRRCRSGFYSAYARTVPIYMRTARGELYIRREAAESGANGYFLAGSEDSRLIDTIEDLIVKGRGNAR